MDNQITYNEALIDERDQGIAEISQQIGEVNEIFQVSSAPHTVLAIACAQAARQAGRQVVLCCAGPWMTYIHSSIHYTPSNPQIRCVSGIHCPCECLLTSRCSGISGHVWRPAWHCTAPWPQSWSSCHCKPPCGAGL